MIPGGAEGARFREQRRKALRGNRAVHALDRVEATPAGDAQPTWRLRLRFVDRPPDGLGPGSFRILDPAGEVDAGVQVTRLAVAAQAGTVDVFVRVADAARARRLRSDPASYRLEIDAPGIDRFFDAAPFRFDGRPPAAEPEPRRSGEQRSGAAIDYLAKDYASFRRLMLERMAAHVPEWTERNPADVGVAIVEVLAYAADYLSYYQDAVATEAYLDTARRRSSVRRHLRLLGYSLHEGCNARVWVQLGLAGDRPLDLPAGSELLTRAGDLPPVLLAGSPQHAAALEQGSLTFETLHPVRLRPSLDRLPVYRWGADEYSLPRGATALALAGHHPELAAGDVLVLEPLAPAAGEPGEAERPHLVRLASRPRCTEDPLTSAAITELELCDEDALPRALTVSSGGDGSPGERLVVRGNVVLADHGRTLREELPPVVAGQPYRPVLGHAPLTWRQPAGTPGSISAGAAGPAQEPRRALPAIELRELHGGEVEGSGEPWKPRRDLLESSPFASHFVVETETDGSARLRFGDGRQGRRPTPGSRFLATYRVGCGPAGHVGPGALAHLVSDSDLPVTRVHNPLPARGGEPPEPLETARLVAPRAFRRTASCVTPADVARLAESQPGVLRAAAGWRWTGSWRTVFLHIQRPGGRRLGARFERRLRRSLEPALLAGTDLAIRPPEPLPLEVALRVTLAPAADAERVRRAVRRRLIGGEGETGYFDPDAFGFGQPVFLDGVLDAALEVPGVEATAATVFRTRGTTEGDAVRARIEPGPFEIVSLRDSAAEPWLGTLELELEEGS